MKRWIGVPESGATARLWRRRGPRGTGLPSKTGHGPRFSRVMAWSLDTDHLRELNMRSVGIPLGLACLLAAGASAAASDPVPEIQRAPFPAQADGALTTLRIIPEACLRLEGRFTGERGRPFSISAAPSRSRCLPHARLVDAAEARPDPQHGWRLNDVIRVPSARCPGQWAQVQVWRESTGDAVPTRDAQGRVRVYLHDAMSPAARAQARPLPRFVAKLVMQGPDCR